MFKSIKKRLKDQRGLTLVELLAVVVILGIIAGIAVPNIGKIISNTEEDAKVSEGIQIIQAAKLYVASEGFPASTLDKSELSEYLDNIVDDRYVVTVTKVGGNGKYSYSLTVHNSVDLVDTKTPAGNTPVAGDDNIATEAELLAY
jgi:type IV pilus assembly protein PilA